MDERDATVSYDEPTSRDGSSLTQLDMYAGGSMISGSMGQFGAGANSAATEDELTEARALSAALIEAYMNHLRAARE